MERINTWNVTRVSWGDVFVKWERSGNSREVTCVQDIVYMFQDKVVDSGEKMMKCTSENITKQGLVQI